jgi:meso-butanediol dehydrogenase/(S,S)-butanediol dehydrogenase/diacetyl reductase
MTSKTAIITGGSRGIGRGIVDRFHKDDWNIVTCSRGQRPNDLDDKIVWEQADVGNPKDVNRIIEKAISTFGIIDLLVNNAGVQIEKNIIDSNDNDFNLVVDSNCRGVFNMCRATLEHMIKSGGSIINIGSISGNASDPSMALYNASKAFVHGLTRSIAIDHGPTVRCNAVCPGWVMTEMADDAFELASKPKEAKKDALSRHPVGRFGRPDDIANMVAWLASDESGYVTGQLFTVDGGLTAASPINPGLF